MFHSVTPAYCSEFATYLCSLEHIYRYLSVRVRDLYSIKGSNVTTIPPISHLAGWSEIGSGPSGRRSGTGGCEECKWGGSLQARQAGRYNKLSNESGLHLPAASLINPTISHRRPSMRERAYAIRLYIAIVVQAMTPLILMQIPNKPNFHWSSNQTIMTTWKPERVDIRVYDILVCPCHSSTECKPIMFCMALWRGWTWICRYPSFLSEVVQCTRYIELGLIKDWTWQWYHLTQLNKAWKRLVYCRMWSYHFFLDIEAIWLISLDSIWNLTIV